MTYSDYKKEIFNLVTTKIREYQSEMNLFWNIDGEEIKTNVNEALKLKLDSVGTVQYIFSNHICERAEFIRKNKDRKLCFS